METIIEIGSQDFYDLYCMRGMSCMRDMICIERSYATLTLPAFCKYHREEKYGGNWFLEEFIDMLGPPRFMDKICPTLNA